MAYQLPKKNPYVISAGDQFHIERNPPSSIHTRKKERVDTADILNKLSEDNSRYTESINPYQRGTNQMVDISYNSSGGGSKTNTMPNIQSSSVRKIGNIRPPEFTLKDSQALSRQRRPDTSVVTNPGVKNIVNVFDVSNKSEITRSINQNKVFGSIRPTTSIKMQVPVEIFTKYAIQDNKMNFSAGTNLKSIENYDINRLMSSNIHNSINQNNLSTNANTNLQSYINTDVNRYMSNNIPDQINENKLTTSIGSSMKSFENFEINRFMSTNSPDSINSETNIIAVGTSINNKISGENYRNEEIQREKYTKDVLLKNLPSSFSIIIHDRSTGNSVPVKASIKEKTSIAIQSGLGLNINLAREDGTIIKLKDYQYKAVTTNSGSSAMIIYVNNDNELNLQRNVPLHATETNVSGYTVDNRLANHTLNSKVQSSATTSLSMLGREETNRQGTHNIQVRDRDYGGFSNYGSMAKPQFHNIPTINSRSLTTRQLAAENMLGRYDQH